MTATRADVRLSVASTRNGTPLGGGLVAEILRDLSLPDGDSAAAGRAINRQLEKLALVVPQLGVTSVDLQTEAAPPDAALGLTKLKLLYVRADPANTQPITLDAATGANGWSLVVGGSVVIEPGEEMLLLLNPSAANVTPTEKVLFFSTGAGVDQTIAQLVVLGSAP